MTVADLAGRHHGAPCYVLGNGPSLRGVRLAALAERGAVSIGCNEGPLHFPDGFRPTYWTVEDPLDWRQFFAEFSALDGMVKVVPEDMAPAMPGALTVRFLRTPFTGGADRPRFGAAPPFHWGATVSYLMLQLAVWLGCAPIYLLGQDFSWDFSEAADVGKVMIVAGARDGNHFAPGYWPKGTKSYAPFPGLMRAAFEAAREACAAAGVPVVNVTAGSKLDTFVRGEMPEWLRAEVAV